jgi:hypothetical protein
MMEEIDKMRQERTGVNSVTQGLDAEALANSTNFVGSMIMNTSMMRIKMIARLFAETGFKNALLYIHELILKNEKNERIAELNDEFFTVDPTSWRTRRNMTVNVGIGKTEKRERVMALERIIQLQETIFAAQGPVGPLLDPTNVYNALQDMLEISGMDSRDRYFNNPVNFQPPPPPENPQSEALEIAEAEVTLRAQTAAAKHELDTQKHADEVRLREQEMLLKAEIEKLKLEQDTILTREGYVNNLEKEVLDNETLAKGLAVIKGDEIDEAISG